MWDPGYKKTKQNQAPSQDQEIVPYFPPSEQGLEPSFTHAMAINLPPSHLLNSHRTFDFGMKFYKVLREALNSLFFTPMILQLSHGGLMPTGEFFSR